MPSRLLLATFLIFMSAFAQSTEPTHPIVVSSKRFTENYILGEIFAQLLESKGFPVKRRLGLGGTMVAFDSVKTGAAHVYPDYTGTLSEAVLRTGDRDYNKINSDLKKLGVEMLPPLGFNNSYCTVIKKSISDKFNIKTISDLAKHPEFKGAFSFEFQERDDGWEALKKAYGLKNPVQGIEVPLTYEALKNDKVDFVEAYSTEPLIKKNDFIILEDDKNFFPKYDAVAVVRMDLYPEAKETLKLLSGKITHDIIVDLNSRAVNGESFINIANDFLISQRLVGADMKKEKTSTMNWAKLWERTQTHMYLTLLAVLVATLVAVPLATLIAPYQNASRIILGGAGILQTIPSIALLTFMIPFFGIGFLPAIIGLFIYSLLPILQNTHVAMSGIDPRLITAARGIGLYPREILFSVKLPLAFPTILAGIRTATIMNIGTATLAAFIGAGGLGEPIVTGLALNDSNLVLQGAIPVAALAILMDGFFSLLNKRFAKKI